MSPSKFFMLILFFSNHVLAGTASSSLTITSYHFGEDKIYLTANGEYIQNLGCKGLAVFVIRKPSTLDWIFMKNKIAEAGLENEKLKIFSEEIFSEEKTINTRQYKLPVGFSIPRKKCLFHADALFIEDNNIWFFWSSNPIKTE